MRGKWLLFGGSIILLAIAAGAVTAWRREQAKPAAAAPAPVPAPVVINPDLSLSGKVEARNVVSVRPATSGTVEEYLVNPGEEVFEGQLVARIHNQQLENEREQARLRADTALEKANGLDSQLLTARLEVSRARAEATRIQDDYNRAERNYQRQNMLHQQGATPRLTFEKSQKDFETARLESESTTARLKVAEARMAELTRDIEAAKKTLEERNAALETTESVLQASQVHAPVDGIVLSRKGDAGTEIQAGADDLMRIATELGSLQVTVEADAAQAKRLQPGMAAQVFLTEMGNEPLTGEIATVTENKVLVYFNNPNPLVRPGVTAQVKIRIP